MGVPGRRERRPRLLARQRQALRRPGLEAHAEQRQVEQPFAGIIDDVEHQLAHRAGPRLVFDDHPQLADLAGRFRPHAVGDKGVHMVLIIEPGHRVVGLGGEPRAGDAVLVLRLEHRKPAAAHQPVHQRGDEDGLARPRQAGDAEPHRRIEQASAIFGEGAGGEPGLFEEIGEGGHGSAMWSGGAGTARPRTGYGEHICPQSFRRPSSVLRYLTTPEMQQGRWRGGVRRFLRKQRGPDSA